MVLLVLLESRHGVQLETVAFGGPELRRLLRRDEHSCLPVQLFSFCVYEGTVRGRLADLFLDHFFVGVGLLLLVMHVEG
jgi:hypothetical protein